jgi:transcriptional regulator with XRE-family HTH domain
MASRSGISKRTLSRLETLGPDGNPPLRYLVNCARVLGLPLEDVLEPAWLDWLELGPPEPPPQPR